jgi:hypothetical protein
MLTVQQYAGYGHIGRESIALYSSSSRVARIHSSI